MMLHIAGISEACTEGHLQAFGAYGEVADCYIPRDMNGADKGIAFAIFSSVDEAVAAKRALDVVKVAGGAIKVEFADAQVLAEFAERRIKRSNHGPTSTSRNSTADLWHFP